MAVSINETETKYDAPADTALPDLAGLPQVAATSGPDVEDLDAFSYGLLYEHDACDGARLQAQARRTWQRASRPRYRQWMR